MLRSRNGLQRPLTPSLDEGCRGCSYGQMLQAQSVEASSGQLEDCLDDGDYCSKLSDAQGQQGRMKVEDN